MHFIQKHILDVLRTRSTVHYAELNTLDIESGHFRYHLRELIKDGLVVQQDRGIYSLTPEGARMVDRLSQKHGAPHAMPKVITYTLLTSGGSLFLQRKQKEPYKGLLNMIGGKLHEGESSEAAAIREVQEKTGLSIVAPKLRGIFEVQISQSDTLLSHVIAYVYAANIADEEYDTLERVQKSALTQLTDCAPDLIPIISSLLPNQVVTKNLQIKLD